LEVPSASDLWDSPTWQAILKGKVKQLGVRSFQDTIQRPEWELFDVTADPNEAKNLLTNPTSAVTKEFESLKARLTAWRKATNDPWLIKDKHE